MLRVILVDDEPPAIRAMRRLLADHPDVAIVAEAESVAEAAEHCARHRPDLVFLDVTLADGLGFDLMATASPPPLVVLVTGCATHAVRAFELGALDYLLKPVDPKRLAITMKRVRHAVSGTGARAIAGHGKLEGGRMVLPEGADTVIVPFDMIGLLDAEGDFTRILRVDGRDHLICRRLGQFEEQLPSPPFFRAGRSCIINLDHMTRIEGRGSDGSLVYVQGVQHPMPLGRAATQRLRKVVAESRFA